MKKFFWFGFLFLCTGTTTFAQKNMRVTGSATDSVRSAVPGATVLLLLDRDTIRTTTDDKGIFNITGSNLDRFTLQVNAIGYHRYSSVYTFSDSKRVRSLEPIVLKMSSQLLKDVVVKAKPVPVRFMQDTVEYNVAAFNVKDGDNVADLLRQFPGMEVDDQYNVKTGGREMVKLRVNGVDFFTNNVQDFIGKLPAGIVSKIQVVDDFGDEANFTGIKSGEPAKMLNIVTKPGMNKGKFGSLSASAGTNEQLGTAGSINLWNGKKQSSANTGVSSFNNGAGASQSLNSGLLLRDQLTPHTNASVNYNFNRSSSAFSREQVTESFNPEGKFTNNSTDEGEGGVNNHNLSWNMTFNDKKTYVQAAVRGSFRANDNRTFGVNNLSGVMRQDLRTNNDSRNTAPNIGALVSYSKKLKNNKNSFSLTTSFNLSDQRRDQQIGTNTLYYDSGNGALLKDSVLTRDVGSRTTSRSFGFGFNYSLGLKRTRDTLGRHSLNMNYQGSTNQSLSEVETYVLDDINSGRSFVDSLSSLFSSVSLQQSVGVNYNYSSPRMRYNFSFSAMPNLMSNRDERLQETIRNNTFNYNPSLNFSRTFPQGRTFNATYRGATNSPTIYQLQPVRNAQSLQNVEVGNPNLKPSFSHNMNLSFNYVHVKSGRSAQVGLTATATQREIMHNVTLLPDTLNSFKQVARYENVNGNYQVNGNYFIHLPINGNKFSLRYSGSIGFSHRAMLYNSEKAFGKGINLNQQLDGGLSLKKLSFNANASYSVTNNNSISSMANINSYQPLGIGQIAAPAFFTTTNWRLSLDGNVVHKGLAVDARVSYNSSRNSASINQPNRTLGNLSTRLSGRFTVRKSYFITFNASQESRYGYALSSSNPLILSAGLEKAFLKGKELRLSVSGSDLLGQGNNALSTVIGNTIVDSRVNQQTRVFAVNLVYNLSRFGDKQFWVDAD